MTTKIHDEKRAWASLSTLTPRDGLEFKVYEANMTLPETKEAPVLFEGMVDLKAKPKLPENVQEIIDSSLYRQTFYMLREALAEGTMPSITKKALMVALDELQVTYSPKMTKAQLVNLAKKKVAAIQEAQGQAKEFQP